MSKIFNFHIPISKIDEEERVVWGVATTEAVDSQGDIVDYEASKSAFSRWLGNIREMHQPVAVGKAIDIQFDDENKQVLIGAKISESTDGENAWTKVKEGILNGFSIGGNVNKVTKEVAKKNGKDVNVTRIMDYDLSETSLVDNPANPEAMFVMVKSQNGGLQRIEHEATEAEMSKGIRLPAWHMQFMLPIEKAQSLYDESMKTHKMEKAGIAVLDEEPKNDKGVVVTPVINGPAPIKPAALPKPIKRGKESEMKKSMYDAAWLLDLAIELSYYINNESYEGDDVAELKSALDTIKQAVVKELSEPTAELTVAVELAQKNIDLAKSKVADMTKSTAPAGGEERNDKAEVVTTAEENGRPVNDTEERAADAGVEVAGAVVEDAEGNEVVAPAVKADEVAVVEEPKVEKPADAPKKEVKVEEPKTDEAKKDDAPAEDAEKSVTIGDLKKFTDGLFSKLGDSNKAELTKVLGEFAGKVEKSITSLEDRMTKFENQPASPKAVASFVEIEKGAEKRTGEEVDVAALLKRRDELVANPNEGTPAERMELATQLRKAQASGAKLS